MTDFESKDGPTKENVSVDVPTSSGEQAAAIAEEGPSAPIQPDTGNELLQVMDKVLTTFSLQAADVWLRSPSNDPNSTEDMASYVGGMTKTANLAVWTEISANPTMTRPIGKGLPGRIIASQRPEWEVDDGVRELDPNLHPRGAAARALGLQTVFGIPVFKGASGEYQGALCFYASEAKAASQQVVSFIAELAVGLTPPAEGAGLPETATTAVNAQGYLAAAAGQQGAAAAQQQAAMMHAQLVHLQRQQQAVAAGNSPFPGLPPGMAGMMPGMVPGSMLPFPMAVSYGQQLGSAFAQPQLFGFQQQQQQQQENKVEQLEGSTEQETPSTEEQQQQDQQDQAQQDQQVQQQMQLHMQMQMQAVQMQQYHLFMQLQQQQRLQQQGGAAGGAPGDATGGGQADAQHQQAAAMQALAWQQAAAAAAVAAAGGSGAAGGATGGFGDGSGGGGAAGNPAALAQLNFAQVQHAAAMAAAAGMGGSGGAAAAMMGLPGNAPAHLLPPGMLGAALPGGGAGSGGGGGSSSRLSVNRGKGPMCIRPGCPKVAQGSTELCIAHGGGRRCTHTGCTRGARDRFFCAGHGGGKRCGHGDCKKSAVGSTPFCTAHGGGRRCQHEACTKSAQSATSFCVRHGGGRKCGVEGCEKVARGRTKHCAGHGGGIRCSASGCRKAAIGATLLCRSHQLERDADPASAALYQLHQGNNTPNNPPSSSGTLGVGVGDDASPQPVAQPAKDEGGGERPGEPVAPKSEGIDEGKRGAEDEQESEEDGSASEVREDESGAAQSKRARTNRSAASSKVLETHTI